MTNKFLVTQTTYKRNWKDLWCSYCDGADIGTLGSLIDQKHNMLHYIKLHRDGSFGHWSAAEVETRVFSNSMDLQDEIVIDWTGFSDALEYVVGKLTYTDILEAPFTQDQVEALNKYQNSLFHPFTCNNDRNDEAHTKYKAEHGGDLGQLIATGEGWICPVCDYKQGWAHPFMVELANIENPF